MLSEHIMSLNIARVRLSHAKGRGNLIEANGIEREIASIIVFLRDKYEYSEPELPSIDDDDLLAALG